MEGNCPELLIGNCAQQHAMIDKDAITHTRDMHIIENYAENLGCI